VSTPHGNEQTPTVIRAFLAPAAAIAGLGGADLAMARALLPRYARAQEVKFTDPRVTIRSRWCFENVTPAYGRTKCARRYSVS
jgi:hypothetical protein